jgi:arabinose-5-phosphate isomerase
MDMLASEKKDLINEARAVLTLEADSILSLVDRVGEGFAKMIEVIDQCKGRVIIGGIGKSGIIARKIVATLNSTGTRALFLHPVEAMHGDLGSVSPEDILIALSASGETDELNILIPSIHRIGCTIIAFTGNKQSSLAHLSDIIIDVGVEREACPLGLAPTSSTTAMLAMGDALAVVLINRKKFKSDDFKRFHPGGTLGQRLASEVGDIMLTGEAIPAVSEGTGLISALAQMNRHNLGVILVLGQGETLAGIITDGDIRRAVVNGLALASLSVDDIMTREPQTAQPDSPAYDALNTMEKFQITVLPIINHNRRVEGILHLHDILGKGEFKFNGMSSHH